MVGIYALFNFDHAVSEEKKSQTVKIKALGCKKCAVSRFYAVSLKNKFLLQVIE
jgi:hypothetical protein